MNIELELQKVTKVKPKSGESRQDYLGRMVEAMPINSAWDELPVEVQEWANKMIAADNADEVIPDFPEQSASTEEQEKMEPGTNGHTAPKKKKSSPAKSAPKKSAAPTKKATKSAAPPKKAAKTKPEAKERVAREPREDGIKYRIKKMLAKDPNLSVEDITSTLKKDGVKNPSKFTVTAMRAEFRHTCQVLRDLGWPKVAI